MLLHLYSLLRQVRRDDGATMVEYGLMVALIAVIALAGAQVLGVNVLGIFNRAATELNV